MGSQSEIISLATPVVITTTTATATTMMMVMMMMMMMMMMIALVFMMTDNLIKQGEWQNQTRLLLARNRTY
jgi:Ca2+/H+ antiporter